MPGYDIKLPMKLTSLDNGAATTKEMRSTIEQMLENIVNTNKGEKIMQSGFGAGIEKYLFQPINDKMKVSISSTVAAQIKKWLPSMLVEEIVVQDSKDNSLLYINIKWSYPSLNLSGEKAIKFSYGTI